MAAGPTDHLDAELREAENRIQKIYDKILEVKDVDQDKKEAKCWDLYDRLKPKHPCPKQWKINFRTEKTNLKALKIELENALVKEKTGHVSDNAKKKVEKFVQSLIDEKGKHHMTDLESAMGVLKKVGAPQYMQHRLIELSKAEKVRWDTDDGRASKSDMTNFWDVTYGHRKQIEAETLWRILESDDLTRHAPTRALLPIMYWLKDMEGGPTWAEWNPYDPRSNPSSNPEPPPWALEYINTKTAQKKMNGKGSLFHPNAKPYQHANAVYLLLCRFNGEGVPKEARVQAYAGMATDGVKKRWMEHAHATQGLMQRLSELKTFSATPLQSVTLVEVVVGRLYAEGKDKGRKFITETDVDSHDNIALFIYRAYGENEEGDETKANTNKMENTEGDLIRELELTKMGRGMNKKKKKIKTESGKNAKGDKTKTKDIKKTE